MLERLLDWPVIVCGNYLKQMVKTYHQLALILSE